MNRTRLLGGLTAASLLLIAGAASAQTAPNSPAQPRELRADADRDGRLSKAEFVEARLAPLTAMDADRDGTVSAAERAASRQARAAAMATRRFETLDADKDGVVSRAEFDAVAQQARPERAGARGRHHGARHAGRRAGRHAGNARPGMEAGQARAAAAPVVIADVRLKAEAAFDRLDADKDGFVARTEMQAARTAMRERREARRGEMKADGATREARREARRQRRELASPASPASE